MWAPYADRHPKFMALSGLKGSMAGADRPLLHHEPCGLLRHRDDAVLPETALEPDGIAPHFQVRDAPTTCGH